MSHYDEARGLLSGVIAQNATLVADATHAATSKATPVDADEIPLADSAASFTLKKLTWANLKATLLTWLTGILASPPPIGSTVRNTGAFTTLLADTSITTAGGPTVISTYSALSNGAGAGAGTLLNAPAAGNPTKWIGINDNGTIRYIPTW